MSSLSNSHQPSLCFSTFSDVVIILCTLINRKLIFPAEITAKTVPDVQAVINETDTDCVEAAAIIHGAAVKLLQAPFEGVVPQNKEDLMKLDLDDTVASRIMQNVFGDTDLIVGLHTRKLVVALDMYDWEESGVKEKEEVKMAKIPVEHVKKSLLVWIPRGERRSLQDALESLGAAIGRNQSGFWGIYSKIAGSHFSTKEKKQLIDMAESICQFYKAVKGGG